MLEGSLCCRIKHFCDYSWYEVFLQNDWHISYLSILLQNETANSAIMKDTFFVLILSEWKYYLSLSLAKVWRIDASHWLPTVLYPGSSVTLGTCLLQIILASVQVTGVTGVVRRQGGSETRVSRLSLTEVTVKAALGRGVTSASACVNSNVTTTWDTVIPRRILRRIARTRKTRRTQNNIQKMHDLGNNKWTTLAVTFYVFSDLYLYRK